MAKQYRITINAGVNENTELVEEYYGASISAVIFPDVIKIINERAEAIPETFKINRTKNPLLKRA